MKTVNTNEVTDAEMADCVLCEKIEEGKLNLYTIDDEKGFASVMEGKKLELAGSLTLKMNRARMKKITVDGVTYPVNDKMQMIVNNAIASFNASARVAVKIQGVSNGKSGMHEKNRKQVEDVASAIFERGQLLDDHLYNTAELIQSATTIEELDAINVNIE